MPVPGPSSSGRGFGRLARGAGRARLSGARDEKEGLLLRKIRPAIPVVVLLLAAACARVDDRVQEGYTPVTGGKVWYRIVGVGGSGTPLLVLHGGPGFDSGYLTPLEALSDERPVVLYDQLGSGRSERPDDLALWRIERFVGELAQVRDALGLERVHLYGHSWGTQLAADYVLTGPAGVASLILASPIMSIPRWIEDAEALRSELPEETQAVLAAHEQAGTTDSEEYQAAMMEYYRRYLCRLDPWPQILEQTFERLNEEIYGTMWGPSEFYLTGTLKDYDRTARLGEISIPVLFTAGRYDEATPDAAGWYRSLVPGASLVIFEESAHLPMIEETSLYLDALRAFLRKADSR